MLNSIPCFSLLLKDKDSQDRDPKTLQRAAASSEPGRAEGWLTGRRSQFLWPNHGGGIPSPVLYSISEQHGVMASHPPGEVSSPCHTMPQWWGGGILSPLPAALLLPPQKGGLDTHSSQGLPGYWESCAIVWLWFATPRPGVHFLEAETFKRRGLVGGPWISAFKRDWGISNGTPISSLEMVVIRSLFLVSCLGYGLWFPQVFPPLQCPIWWYSQNCI